MTRRQLQLPGLAAPRPAALLRAKRDMSAAAFARALSRNGFKRAGDLHFLDPATGADYVAVVRTNPIRIARRATLAKLLRLRTPPPKLEARRKS